MNLARKTVLVTGGGRRLGAALCRALAARGCRVVIHYHRSAGPARRLARRLRARGAQAWTVGGDLSAPEAPARVVARARAAAGRLDILVNNAAVFRPGGALRAATADDLQAHWAVNVRAPLLLMQAFARGTRHGRVLNLLDRRVFSNRTDAAYALSKKALAELTRLAALELAPRIAVNGVAPGPVLRADRPDTAREPAGPIPLGRRPAVRDVVAAALFLLEAESVTGQIVCVDGGQHLLG